MNAPSAEELPVFPASWYLFGPTGELGGGPMSRDLLGQRLAAYRTASGPWAVLDARCAHLGADLGEGCVVGDDLQCAFHNWQYGPHGRCTLVPSLPAAGICPLAVLSRPRYGMDICFFSTARNRCSRCRFLTTPGLRITWLPGLCGFDADCPWHLVNANSFDVQHFRAGHDRDLLGEPAIDCPHPCARRIRVNFAVAGHSVFDRLLCAFIGPEVEVSMTNWGGSIVVVTGQFRRHTQHADHLHGAAPGEPLRAECPRCMPVAAD